MRCPSRQELSDCLTGRVPDAQADRVLEHIQNCDTCAVLLGELDQATDELARVLRTGHSTTTVDVSQGCERMIAAAEKLIPNHSAGYVASTPMRHLLQGTSVRDYEIVRPLGEGGMGAVFLAHHKRLDTQVALKVLSLRRSQSVEAQMRFEREMTIVGKLQHPGIVRALDAGEQDGVQYLVMELIEGRNLREVVDTVGPIPLAEACEICRQAAISLDYAHLKQLIHRDIKPSNLMLSLDGTVKILDLGLAKWTDQQRFALTSTEQALGSLNFMAPEQLHSEQVDHRADIYSLGCTLHFLLSGDPPEKRQTASLLVSRGPRLDQIREILPPPLTRLLQQMLAVEPEKRIESAAEVAVELEPFCARADLRQLSEKAGKSGEIDQIDRPSSLTTSQRVSRRSYSHGWLAGTLVAVPLLLTLTAVLAWSFGRPDDNQLILDALPTKSSRQIPTHELPLFQLHQEAIRCLAFCQETSQLICGSDDAAVSIRDLPDQRHLRIICPFDAPVQRVHVASQATRCVGLDELGQMVIFELPSGEFRRIQIPNDVPDRVIDVLILADGNSIIAADEGGGLRVIEISTGEVIVAATTREGTISKMMLGGKGETLITLHRNGEIRWRALETLELLDKRAKVRENSMYVVETDEGPHCFSLGAAKERRLDGEIKNDLSLSASSPLRFVEITDLFVACVGTSNEIRLIDWSTPNQPQQFVYSEHRFPITVVDALAANLFLTADESGEIRLWHAPNGPLSDMIFMAPELVNSRIMSHSLRKRTKWTRKAFENVPADEISMLDENGKPMTISSTIRRELDHTLTYSIDTNPNIRPE